MPDYKTPSPSARIVSIDFARRRPIKKRAEAFFDLLCQRFGLYDE